MTIGEKIKELRRKNDLTQEKLADYLRVSYQAVSKWETGVTCPDLSMLAPLTKLLHTSADELLGLAGNEPDARRTELDASYEDTWKTGDLQARWQTSSDAASEYPGDMKYLERLAWAEACRSFEFKDDETYRAEQEKAIKHFAMVIEDCEDEKIRRSAITGIVQYLSFRGRKDEAKKYAELLPEGREKYNVLEFCLSGDELIFHKQEKLDGILNEFISSLDMNYNLSSDNAIMTILKAMIPDENYLVYHVYLYNVKIRQARRSTENCRYNEVVEQLGQARYHAQKYDGIYCNSGIYKYTSPLFDHYEFDSGKFVHTGTRTQIDGFEKELSDKRYDPLRGREDFIALLK